MPYTDEEMLMLSGIQHFAFCPRQWGLAYIDLQWEDNVLTTEGQIVHRHVDDPAYRPVVRGVVCLRSVRIASSQLGLYGVADLIELYPSDRAIPGITLTHPGYPGHWRPYPIEYKHGKPKRDNVDAVQLAAQAMCLEEQYGIRIPEGAIYYAEIRRREIVEFSDELRSEVVRLTAEMHRLFGDGTLPQAERRPACRSCSLVEVCMPDTARPVTASEYLKRHLYAQTP